jgi:hypothetical protein
VTGNAVEVRGPRRAPTGCLRGVAPGPYRPGRWGVAPAAPSIAVSAISKAVGRTRTSPRKG